MAFWGRNEGTEFFAFCLLTTNHKDIGTYIKNMLSKGPYLDIPPLFEKHMLGYMLK
jgi:hypothetical protein